MTRYYQWTKSNFIGGFKLEIVTIYHIRIFVKILYIWSSTSQMLNLRWFKKNLGFIPWPLDYANLIRIYI